MYRVGHFLNPLSSDPSYTDLKDARAQASQLASKCEKSAIAIWDERDDTISLFLNNEEFRPA